MPAPATLGRSCFPYGSALAPTGGVVLGGQRSDRLRAGAHVALQGAQVRVPALRHQQRERDVVLPEVGQRGPAQVVQRAASGGGDEQFLGPPVGEAGVPGLRAEIRGGRCSRRDRRPVGEEERTRCAGWPGPTPRPPRRRRWSAPARRAAARGRACGAGVRLSGRRSGGWSVPGRAGRGRRRPPPGAKVPAGA
jgi:hypothetical protein